MFNPAAGSAERVEQLRALIETDDSFELCKSEGPGHVGELAGNAVRDGRRVVVAAGGDGTISEVVGGLMDAREAEPGREMPHLLVIPMGTGNDFRRTFDLPEELEESVRLFEAGRTKPLDVMRWRLEPADGGEARTGWSVNVVAGGFAAKLTEVLTPEMKKTWGPLAYARAALSSAEVLDPHATTISIDGGPAQTIDAVNLVVANARFAGGGIEVAPHADPTDGRLDFVAIKPGNFLEYVGVTKDLIAGEVDENDHAYRVSCRSITVEGRPPLPFNVDGDPVGEGRLSVEVVPNALRVLVP